MTKPNFAGTIYKYEGFTIDNPSVTFTYDENTDIYDVSVDDSIHHSGTKIHVMMNSQTDKLLNLYGDLTIYKSLPDVGENIEGTLMAIRKRYASNNFAGDELSILENLAIINKYDHVIYAEGTVLDILVNAADISKCNDESVIKYFEARKIWRNRICTTCDLILDSKSKYTNVISDLRSEILSSTHNNATSGFDNSIAITAYIKEKRQTQRYGSKTMIASVYKKNIHEQ